MVKCKNCNNKKTILARGAVESFIPDSEPYENGVVEDCGFEEIMPSEDVDVYIQWCPHCGKIADAFIESPRFD